MSYVSTLEFMWNTCCLPGEVWRTAQRKKKTQLFKKTQIYIFLYCTNHKHELLGNWVYLKTRPDLTTRQNDRNRRSKTNWFCLKLVWRLFFFFLQSSISKFVICLCLTNTVRLVSEGTTPPVYQFSSVANYRFHCTVVYSSKVCGNFVNIPALDLSWFIIYSFSNEK